MRYFDKDFSIFFEELEKNNTKEWFDKNRKRYERSVKKPFKEFVLKLVDTLQELYPNKDLSNKYSIMRINRDVRFSKDKTPYKVQMSSIILPNGKGNKTLPGFYIQANHKDIRVYSGAHMLDKKQLNAIRLYIKDNLNEFNSLIKSPDFSNTFGEIQGKKHKRIPIDFKEMEAIQPLIANKEFYWFFKLPSKELTSDSIVNQLVDKYKKSLPVNHFFERALLS